MIFPQLARFTDVALLLLRLMVGIVFVTSGYKHLKDPETRSKDIEMSKGFTIFLGAAELAGGLGVISGVLAQLAAIGLILLMLGAIQKKIFVWHSGFWGKSGTNGWIYETMLIVMNLVIADHGRWKPRPHSPVQVSPAHALSGERFNQRVTNAGITAVIATSSSPVMHP